MSVSSNGIVWRSDDNIAYKRISADTSYSADNTFSITDFNGDATQYTFDAQGQITDTVFPDGRSLAYSYSSSGALDSVSDDRGTTRFTYDDGGRLVQQTDPDGTAIAYEYDASGRRVAVTVPSGTTRYDYDASGRLLGVSDPDGQRTSYTYDADDNLAGITYPNGAITEYGYDTLNRQISVINRTITSDLIMSASYTLGPKGERIRVEEQIGDLAVRTIEYTYDEVDRLIEERIDDSVLGLHVITYAYDPVGNRIQKDENGVMTTYEYDDNDRLLSSTQTGVTTTYAYDNNGNMLSQNGNGEQYAFTYDALNQLTRADITTPSGATTAEYVYDYDGIRVGKTVNSTDVTRYIVDKNRPYAHVLEEQRSIGATSSVTNYVYGHGLVSQATDGATRYYHYDGFHSARALTDNTGAVTDTYQYDAYGLSLNQTGTTNNPYRYRGEQWDDELDSYYLRARYYQPETGRFYSTDPFEGDTSQPITLHRYMYANHDPVNNIDPSGEKTLTNQLIVANVISLLSSYGGWHLANTFQDTFAKASEWFPDAGILGMNFFIKLKGTTPQFSSFFVPSLDLPTRVKHIPNYNILKDTWWEEKLNAGLVVGVEGLWSFGSSQRGFVGYVGPQVESGYAQGFNNRVNITLYTGYVFNLWNYHDYLGPFINNNWPTFSNFYDPEDLVLNEGPWGISWPILSGSWNKSGVFKSQSFKVGGGGTFFSRLAIGDPRQVPYGQLAREWTVIQAAMMTLKALDQKALSASAIVTGVGAAATGVIARSKQLYNKKHNFLEKRPKLEKNRSDGWKSGLPHLLSLPFSLIL